MESTSRETVRAQMEELRLKCTDEIPIMQRRFDSVTASYRKFIDSTKSSEQETIQLQGQVELFFLHENAKTVIMKLIKKLNLRSNNFIEGACSKIRRQIEELERVSGVVSSSLTVDGVPVDSYLTRLLELQGANCVPDVNVSMNVHSIMYNFNPNTGQLDFLSARKAALPHIYFFFSLVYLIVGVFWVYALYSKRLSVHKIHVFMLAMVIKKSLNLLCEAVDKSYIKRNGTAHGWDVFTRYNFRPKIHNPYFAIDEDEEEAASEALKLEDEFEL